MSYKGRWTEPTDRDARKEYRDLRRELKLSRTTKPRRLEIENRLDEIAASEPPRPDVVPAVARWSPDLKGWEWTEDGRSLFVYVGEGKVRRWLSEDEKALLAKGEPSLRHRTEEELDRRKTLPASEEPSILSGLPPAKSGTPEVMPYVPSSTSTADDRKRALDKARAASPAEKAVALLAELPEHPMNKLARELAQYLWNEDRSNPRPDFEVMVQQWVKHWLSPEPWNRHDVRGSRVTVDDAVASALKLAAEKDAADPEWFVKHTERLLDAPLRASPARLEPTPAAPEEPEPHPLVAANANLDATASLVLASDGFLSNLATHSEQMRTQIIVAIGNELRRVGHADASFCARLYENLRPKGLAKFPPRTN